MENRDMIRMANQIAAYFEAYPRTEALSGIANHIKNFWAPHMRKQLAEYIDNGAEGLSPLVTAAVAPKPKSKAKS
jgi:formate dehydrogenase subunit delta